MSNDPNIQESLPYEKRAEEFYEGDEENFPPEDYEPSDLEMMASFGTMWHDWL
tara:strand:- start:18 stop:176 length:159 start_codon:yes stop_codon:yes gene_type:complete